MAGDVENKESSETQLTRGGLQTFWVKIAAVTLGFAAQLLLARILGTAGYGDYSFAITTFNFLVIAAVAGSDLVATRFIAAYRSSADLTLKFLRWVIRRAIVISFSITVAASLAILLIKQVDQRAIWMLSQFVILALPFQVLSLIRQGILRGRKRPVLSVIPEEVIRPIATLIFISVIVSAGDYFWGPFAAKHAVVIFQAATLASFLIGLVMVKRELAVGSEEVGSEEVGSEAIAEDVDREPAAETESFTAETSIADDQKEWRSTALALMFSTVALTIHAQCDIWMLGVLTVSSLVGPYVAAAKYSAFVIFGINAINTALGPMVSACSQDRASLQKLASRAASLSLILSGGIAIVLFMTPGLWLNLFGQGFDAASVELRILVAGNLFNVACGSVGMLLSMTGHHQGFMKILTTSMLLNVLLNALLIPLYGTIGAAIATTVSVIFWNVAALVLVRRRLKIKPTIGGLI